MLRFRFCLWLAVLGWLGAAAARADQPASAPSPAATETQPAHSVHQAHHRFDDIERWVEAFEDPERDAWQKPDQVIEGSARLLRIDQRH